MPSSVMLTIASSEAETMAASSDRVSSSRFCSVTSNIKQRLWRKRPLSHRLLESMSTFLIDPFLCRIRAGNLESESPRNSRERASSITSRSTWNFEMCWPMYSSREYPSMASSAWLARRMTPSGPIQCSATDGVFEEIGQLAFAFLSGQFSLSAIGYVPESQHAPDDLPVLVANRRDVVVDQPFRAVFRNEDVTIRRVGGAILAQHERRWILDWRVVLVHCAEDIAQQFPSCVTLGPAQKRFCHAIHRRNAAAQVGCDNGVADARERRSQQLAMPMCLVPGLVRGISQSDDHRACDRVSQRPDERRGVREPERAARRDKEVVARQISNDGGGDALGVPAYPHRGRNGAVQA